MDCSKVPLRKRPLTMAGYASACHGPQGIFRESIVYIRMHCMLMDLLHGFEVLSTTEETLFDSLSR